MAGLCPSLEVREDREHSALAVQATVLPQSQSRDTPLQAALGDRAPELAGQEAVTGFTQRPSLMSHNPHQSHPESGLHPEPSGPTRLLISRPSALQIPKSFKVAQIFLFQKLRWPRDGKQTVWAGRPQRKQWCEGACARPLPCCSANLRRSEVRGPPHLSANQAWCSTTAQWQLM